MSNCIFCRIGRHEIPSNAIYENDDVFAFHDISPQAPTHAVVIPKQHIASIQASADQDAPLLGTLLRASTHVAALLGLSDGGYRLVINNGADGGQTVDHLHIHILGGRRMTWPPG
jgi:diadenosine tetraphosphate (Ap4A) HIT family hydrolase